MTNEKIFVTRSSMPPYEEYIEAIKPLWESHWLTNMGKYHQELEKELAEYLMVPEVSLVVNGHMALELAIQSFEFTEGSEVITTPFTFISTTHAIVRNKLKPAFCDVKETDGTIDENKIEALITPKTVAILPVHVYGNICNVDEIQRIADKYGLKVIYDAAHAFGVTVDGKSILENGDMSTLSFHATKVYNTIEGGALICRDAATKKRIDYLKNFGFADEVTVVAPGINSKMDEIRSAYGLLNLKQVDQAIVKRKHVTELYRTALNDIPGIRFLNDIEGVHHNYSYFPIFITENEYGMSRDVLYDKLKKNNILARRYFYPLISNFPVYRGLESANPANLPIATKLADQVLCLPMYADLTDNDVSRILQVVCKK